jgi:hypothetical protein
VEIHSAVRLSRGRPIDHVLDEWLTEHPVEPTTCASYALIQVGSVMAIGDVDRALPYGSGGVARASSSSAVVDPPFGPWHPNAEDGSQVMRRVTHAAVSPVLAAAALVTTISLTGCGHLGTHVEQRSNPDPELVAEAIRFCELMTPPDVVVTAVTYDFWQDDSVGITAVMPPGSVEVLLRDSKFTEPLEPGGTLHGSSPADGSEIPTGPTVTSAQERLPGPPARPEPLTRNVLVDRSDPGQALVHLACWD